ncbi:MAG: AsmA family protein [Candidatus Scalinduaceae bacterium]
MRNLTIKITVIFFAFFISIITVISAFVLLLNNGKLTSFIEQKINKKTNLNIKIGDIHLDILSSLRLKQISLRDSKNQKGFIFRCNTFVIHYKPFELLKGCIKNIDLSDVQITLDTEGMKLTSPLALTDAEGPAISIKDLFPKKIHVKNVSVRNAAVQFKIENRILLFSEVNMQINDVQFARQSDVSINLNVSISNHTKTTPPSMLGEVVLKGKYNPSGDELLLYDTSHLSINNNESFNVAGKVASITTEPVINCIINSRNIILSNIPLLLEKLDIKGLPSLTLEGECDIALSIQGNSQKLKLKSNNLIRNLIFTTGDTVFRAKELEFPIEAIFSPSDTEMNISSKGECIVRRGHLRINNKEITALNFPITFTMDYPNQITLSSNVIKGKLPLGNTYFPIEDLISNIKIDINLKCPDTMQFYTSANTTFSDTALLTGVLNRNKKTIRDTTFNIQNMDCKVLSETFKSLIPEHYKDWSFNGSISMDTTLECLNEDKAQEMNTIANVSFSELKFASPEYDYFGEKINGHLKINAKINHGFKQFSLRTKGDLEPFLVQLGLFTTDMKNRKTRLSFNGYYDTQKRSLSEIEGTLSWENLGSITVDGNVLNLTDAPFLDLNIKMKGLSNEGFFETFVKDTIQDSHPALFNASVGGELNAQFHVTGFKDATDADGYINMKELSLEYKDVSIEDLNVDLPISMKYPQTKTSIRKHYISDSQYGTFQIKRLSYGPLEIKDIQTNPTIISSNLFVKDPLKIPIFNGTIDIEDVFVENIVNPDRKINFTFQLNDIDLEKVATSYELTPFEGALNSSVISFQQKEHKLLSEGNIKINVFGGDIIISDLALANFLEPLMGVGFSAEINHLDLGQMSNTFREWGSITGIINGSIKDFVLVAGEPSSFDIELTTERHSKVKQIVSTKFLKSFVPGIGKVLDKLGFTNYKYAVMGLHAMLENDYITLQGTVREGGKELFMKGEGLKRLEIVFQDVDRKIKFKTFLNSFKGMLSSDFEDTKVQFK